MKTSELTDGLLDAWVARALGKERVIVSDGRACGTAEFAFLPPGFVMYGVLPQYSKDWAHGGPLIDSERISFATMGTGPKDENGREPVVAICYSGRKAMEGPTHLIAGMRAIVADKYGDTVPDEAE